ncbi:MAG: hypothetical protein M0D55_04165 [Elusimicrobiota bacterium]|nr:MAG: hypothetical protein M0D55_04165 [Elusimicrobiota bacterium]
MLSPVLTKAPVLDAAGHMALDEAVLDGAPAGAVILRVYSWKGEGCTFGYSQKYADAKAACRPGVLPVRRATGGGIVHHDGDTTFSIVFPWDKTCAPEAIYKNIHRGIHQALKANGYGSGMWTVPSTGISRDCFARAEKADLVNDDGNKILGGALRKKGAKGLYQGSLRLAVPAGVLADGVRRELGEPWTELEPAWLEAGRALEAKYRSADWNERR